MPGAELSLASLEFEPESSYDGAPPAVFVLHGRRSDERELLPVVRELSDELYVVCLRGPVRLPKTGDPLSESDARDIVPWDHGGVAWYEPELSPADAAKPQPRSDQLRRSLDLVSESITTAVEVFDLDADRIGVFGFDQGAVVSLALLLEHPARFDWVVALNGYLPSSHLSVAPEELAGTPVFVSAGEDDQLVPAARSSAAAERLRDLGADVTFQIYRASHGVGPDELRDVRAFVDEHV